jgi:hypothetical protein
MGVQTTVLLRMRNVLQALAMNSATLLHYIRKNAPIENKNRLTKKKKNKKSCQFCKHRLAYINTEKKSGATDDFYHRCGLRDCEVSLSDSCPFFEKEVETDKDIF